MLFPLYLRTSPDPVLRSETVEVRRFDQILEEKVAEMEELMNHYHGQGIAATQVGLLDSLAIIGELGALANLSIEPESSKKTTDIEGCLSLPGLMVEVERYHSIILSGQDLQGDNFQERLDGHLARIAQHEVDHLNGILIIDRASTEERRRWLY